MEVMEENWNQEFPDLHSDMLLIHPTNVPQKPIAISCKFQGYSLTTQLPLELNMW